MLGKLLRTAIDVATLPVAIVKDVFTLGGAATDHGSYTKEKLEEIKDDLEDIA